MLLSSENRKLLSSSFDHSVLKLTILFALIIQLPLLLIAGTKSINNINPDAIAYIRIAQYYSEGNLSLSINGYWGPLLSFLMAPLLKINMNAMAAARIATGFSAIIFLIGSIRLLSILGLTRTPILIAAVIIALFSISPSVDYITPDLLMSGLLLTGLSYTLRAEPDPSCLFSFKAGLFYGAAYLAKAIALPKSIGIILIISLLRIISDIRNTQFILKAVKWNLIGIAVLALPWITVLSTHYGKLTISTSASINHSIVGPHGIYSPLDQFHVPEAGRITLWEDPSRLPYPSWSPFESKEYFIYQLKLMYWNFNTIINHLASFDLFKLGISMLIIGSLYLFPLNISLNQSWRLLLTVVIVMVGIYLPVHSSEIRYFFDCYPLLLGASLGLFMHLIRYPEYNNQTISAQRKRRLYLYALILISISFLNSIYPNLKQAVATGYHNAFFLISRDLAPVLEKYRVRSGAIACVSQNGGPCYYAAFLTSKPFYGNQKNAALDEIIKTGAEFIIIDRDSPSIKDLENNQQFQQLNIDSASNSSIPLDKFPVKIYHID